LSIHPEADIMYRNLRRSLVAAVALLGLLAFAAAVDQSQAQPRPIRHARPPAMSGAPSVRTLPQIPSGYLGNSGSFNSAPLMFGGGYNGFGGAIGFSGYSSSYGYNGFPPGYGGFRPTGFGWQGGYKGYGFNGNNGL
jgi:hypothetical protein